MLRILDWYVVSNALIRNMHLCRASAALHQVAYMSNQTQSFLGTVIAGIFQGLAPLLPLLLVVRLSV